MEDNKKIIVAVDGSEASMRTVAYVAEIIGGRRGFQVGLLHLELTPRMLEWGGSEDAEIEDRTESERDEAYRQMEVERLAKGKAMLRRLQETIAEKGIDVMGLFVQFEEPLNKKRVTSAILDAARDHRAGTIVVGRHGCSGWNRLFHHYVGEELIREGKGVTIWVVE
jgi:nucleotide-binding universal stress UspA family protein